MTRERRITASELAECCLCEQRVVFDAVRGKRRTAESEREMKEGERTHAEMHEAAMHTGAQPPSDSRCFVATALWGPADPRTKALRDWRDRRLVTRWWGSTIVEAYYAVSPMVVRLMRGVPLVRTALDGCLSAFVRHVRLGED